jgi:hypothetical protein
MDNKIVTVLGHDTIQVMKRRKRCACVALAIIPDVLAIIHLQEQAIGRRANVVFAPLVEIPLIDAVNSWLATSNSVDDVGGFYFDKHGVSPLS